MGTQVLEPLKLLPGLLVDFSQWGIDGLWTVTKVTQSDKYPDSAVIYTKESRTVGIHRLEVNYFYVPLYEYVFVVS